jgi:predicted dehydrogenase
MDRRVSIVLVGIGGYGMNYVNALLDYKGPEKFLIKGAVDTRPENCGRLQDIKDMGIPVYNSLEDFYLSGEADLAIISSPIHYHSRQACLALSHGSNVLCEKPVCAAVEELRDMITARDQSGKLAAVGYQWSHSDTMRSLKEDILNGLFGKPVRLKTIVLWPRNKEYYGRSWWAGRKRAKDGAWILDSVANNATAHYLHNMFYVLGSRSDSSARPSSVTAELYRANDIENFDTAAVRAITEEGVEILFYATHPVKEQLNPTFYYEFENATVEFVNGETDGPRNVIARFKDGTSKNYGDPNAGQTNKLWMTIDAVLEGKKPVCGLETAGSHLLCINAMQESVPEIVDFPRSLVKFDEEHQLVWVEGLNDVFKSCFSSGKLPGEIGAPWAKTGVKICLDENPRFRAF